MSHITDYSTPACSTTPPPPPPSSLRNTSRTRVIPKNSQANNIEVNPITLNKSKDKVNFIEEDDIRINANFFF